MSTGARPAIISLTASILPGCASLYVATFNAPPWNESWNIQDALQRLGDLLATPRSIGICLAEPENQIAGFALGHLERSSDDDHFLLQEMCVRPDVQHQGYGTELLHALQQQIAQVTHWYLLTARDGDAAAFYQRNGFRPAGRIGVFVRP